MHPILNWAYNYVKNNSSWFFWPLDTLIDAFLIFDVSQSQVILKGMCLCMISTAVETLQSG